MTAAQVPRSPLFDGAATFRDRVVRDTTCPHCGAEPGASCTGANGRERSRLHKARVNRVIVLRNRDTFGRGTDAAEAQGIETRRARRMYDRG